MRPGAVFVDCYGTLVAGDRPAIEAVLAGVVRRTGLDARRLDRAWWRRFRQLCALSRGDAFETQRALELRAMADALRERGVEVGSDELQLMLAPLFEYWRTARPLPDAVAFLRQWTLCPVVIVSNIDRGDLVRVLAGLPAVAAAITSEDARGYKPDPTVFRHALERTGVAAEQVVHVGDSWESDVEGSRSAGITPIWCDRDNGGASRHGAPRITSFDQLPACLAGLPDQPFR